MHSRPKPNTYLLTPWSTVLLEKLTGLQLVKKFPTFFGNRRFTNAPPPVSILSHLNPVHTPTSRFLKICLHIILPSTPGSSKNADTLVFHLLSFYKSNVPYLHSPVLRFSFPVVRYNSLHVVAAVILVL
jgi:hypothetical protein